MLLCCSASSWEAVCDWLSYCICVIVTCSRLSLMLLCCSASSWEAVCDWLSYCICVIVTCSRLSLMLLCCSASSWEALCDWLSLLRLSSRAARLRCFSSSKSCNHNKNIQRLVANCFIIFQFQHRSVTRFVPIKTQMAAAF